MARVSRAIMQTSLMFVALFFGAVCARPAAAELVNENLLAGAPPGYKIGFRDKKNDLQMTEWVPASQTVENWTEMLTVQVFYGLKIAPEAFMQQLEARWRNACPGAGGAQPIVGSVENGYPSLLWILDCPKNPGTDKPELTWFRAVQGNDSFYVVQKAFKFTPTKEQITRWIGYLKAVRVCDSRIADRACPQTKD
jgi:hypothetical protein